MNDLIESLFGLVLAGLYLMWLAACFIIPIWIVLHFIL